MTSKEFARIREFYGTHYNLQMRGHVWLSPHAVKQIPSASSTVKDWARQRKDIYLKPTKMRVDGNYIKIMCAFNGTMLVERKYIKSVRLFHYNY
jgi:hypothetical protein